MTGQITYDMHQLKVCVLIPTYNNDRTLESVILGVAKYTRDIIIVNDGSTDTTSDVLRKYTHLHLLENNPNQGKGVALYKGMKYAIEKGFDYAITIDSDGQHQPDDIPLFVEKLKQTGEALIIGNRYMEKGKVPGKSYFGRDFSNFWFKVETGIKNPDTQSGFRLYPLHPLKNIKLITRKFEFEIEIIVRLAWKGIAVESVPVSVIYFPEGERVSHFRPAKDFTRISILNTVLVTLALFYYRPKMFLFSKKKMELIFTSDASKAITASSIAFGIFMGILPVWGFQLLIAIFLAFIFKLNKTLVVIFANISIPPMIPVILYLSMVCGSFIVKNPVNNVLIPDSFESMKPFLVQYITGSIVLAIIAAAIAWTVSYSLLAVLKRNK